jgi:large subunit ribosomal protein L24
MAAKLRKGDEVIVLAGKDKGKKGTISSVDPKANKAASLGVLYYFSQFLLWL